jgi:hypothetical protein
MNQTDADHWKSQVLDEIFVALAASKPLDEALVFKGARVLNVRLGVAANLLTWTPISPPSSSSNTRTVRRRRRFWKRR